MDKRKYFERIHSLYEAMGMAGTEEVVPQEQIADAGADVNPDMGMGMDPSMGMGGNIDPMTGMPIPPEPTAAEILEKEKSKKLYELFEDLLQYGEVFIENIRFINTGLLDLERFEKMNFYTNDVRGLLKKIDNYLINIFNKADYDKNLYAYILFRTEFITAIKGLRDILKLEKPDEKLE